MISAYQSLISHSGESWSDHIERIGLSDVFEKLLKAFPDEGDFTCIVSYILYAYSVESEMLVLGSDWTKTKRKIFEKASIKPNRDFYSDLIHLKNHAVLVTIKLWLDYQDDSVFTMLQTLKDLKAEMQFSCLTEIRKSSGEIDYTQKFLNAQYVVDLKKMIMDLESQLIQNSTLLKDSVKEYRTAKSGAKSFGLETFMKDGN